MRDETIFVKITGQETVRYRKVVLMTMDEYKKHLSMLNSSDRMLMNTAIDNIAYLLDSDDIYHTDRIELDEFDEIVKLDK